MSLLSQAMNTRGKSLIPLTEEHMELALGWLNGKVNNSQVERVLFPGQKPNGGNRVYPFLTRALKHAHQEGRLILKK